MMKSEFTARTNYDPTPEEYAEIEQAYYRFNGNKDEFCKSWVKANTWTPYEERHNVRQKDYDELANDTEAKELTDDEAADLIANEFGFQRDKIQIVHSLPTYEINGQNQVRRNGTTERKALFDVWDYNYICFNVKANTTMGYEMYNGDLRMFWG